MLANFFIPRQTFVCIVTGVLQNLLVDLESNFDNVIVSVLHCLRTSLLQGTIQLFLIRKRKWNYTTPSPVTLDVCVIGIGAKSQLI